MDNNLQDTEVRTGKILFNKPGGTAAGANSFTARATIPTSWIRDLGITKDSRDVILTYDYTNKIITLQKAK